MRVHTARTAALLGTITMVCGTAQVAAQSGSPLVSTAWLAEHLDDPNLVLLHVGDRPVYDRGHIRGARLIDLDLVSTPHIMDGEHLMLELPAADELRSRLQNAGLSDDARIVVLAGERRETPAATRVLFTLHHLGLDRAMLLDGGLAAWTAEKRPVTTDAPRERIGRLSVRPVQNAVVTADWVNAQRGKAGVAIVDARTARFYSSTQAQPGGHRAGHIPSAVNVSFDSVLDEVGRFRPEGDLRRLFRSAGVAEGATVVGYCHIGMQATTMLLAARLIGHPVRLYDGSFEDWSRRSELPVVTR